MPESSARAKQLRQQLASEGWRIILTYHQEPIRIVSVSMLHIGLRRQVTADGEDEDVVMAECAAKALATTTRKEVIEVADEQEKTEETGGETSGEKETASEETKPE